MTKLGPLMTPEAARQLTDRLARLQTVSQFDLPGEPQSATIAHSLTHLEKSFREVLETLLPKLLNGSLNGNQLNDVLLDIGEELRHILYHIKDPKFFGYLIVDDRKI